MKNKEIEESLDYYLIEQLEMKVKILQNQINTINNNNEELKRRLKIVQQKRDTHKAVRYKLQNNIDKAITLLEESAKYREPVFIEKQILNILKGDSDE